MNMKQAMKLYGWKMREERRSKKLQQDEVGQMVGVTGTTISYYENGTGGNPYSEGFQKLFKLFGGLGVFDGSLNIIYKEQASAPGIEPVAVQSDPLQQGHFKILRINLDTGATEVITHDELIQRAVRAEEAFAATRKRYQSLKASINDLAKSLEDTAALFRKATDDITNA